MEAAMPPAESVSAEPVAKPKRTRKPKAAEPVAESAAAVSRGEPVRVEPAPEPMAAPEPVGAEATAEAEPVRRHRKELPPDEILVTSSSDQEAAEAKPKKLGWWQRGFFGG
jgi:ribonuclease E